MPVIGNANFAQPPLYSSGIGVNTPWGLVLNPGARIAAIVRSTGVQDLDEPPLNEQIVGCLNAGVNLCRSGMGDVVLVLPGHTQNIDAADWLSNLRPGTRIVGVGDPTQSTGPKLVWTAAAATLLLDQINCSLENLRLEMNGDDDIVAPITVSAAGCRIVNCYLVTGTGAALDAVNPVTVAAGATGFVMAGCKSRQTGGTTTSVVEIGVVDDVTIENNDFQMIGSAAATGVVNVTGAATNLRIRNNLLANDHAASTATLSLNAAASTGVLEFNRSSILANGVAATSGITMGAGCLVRCFENYNCDEPVASGVLCPAACAT